MSEPVSQEPPNSNCAMNDQSSSEKLPVETTPAFEVLVKKEFIANDETKAQRLIPSKRAAPETSKRAKKRKRAEEKKEKICISALRGVECTFPNCRYKHDLTEYFNNKPADLKERCYLFDTFGDCGAGIACRYGNSHIKDGKNIVDKVKKEKNPQPIEMNKISQALQNALRKKSYAKPSVKTMEKETETEKPSVTFTETPLKREEQKKIDWKGKLCLASLTTVGNLPFRRICKSFGCDVTYGEMVMCGNLLQGQSSEWALVKRHPCEDLFGIQLCCSSAQAARECVNVLDRETTFDFLDLNCGCPIDVVYSRGCGAALLERPKRIGDILRAMNECTTKPITIKLRTGKEEKTPTIHSTVLPYLKEWGCECATIHGRSREQRYTKLADWDYIRSCAGIAAENNVSIIGNGDVLSFEDYNRCLNHSNVCGVNIARGALIKPWIFTEIKEQRHWDISSRERLEILQKYANYGLEHWGSDAQGVRNTRTFLCHWLSFLSRYVPVGILEKVPYQMNDRTPVFVGRDDLETLMSSSRVDDWVTLTEMVLGKAEDDFMFTVKHKSYAK